MFSFQFCGGWFQWSLDAAEGKAKITDYRHWFILHKFAILKFVLLSWNGDFL